MDDRSQLDRIKRDRSLLVHWLTDAGATITGKSIACPFHRDESPSGGIIQSESGAFAFSCRACTWNGKTGTGDVFDVVRRWQHCNFAEAKAVLGVKNGTSRSRQTSGDAPETAHSERNGADERNHARQVATDASGRLMEDSGALDHLWKTRGVDRETVELFGLGITDDAPGRRFYTMPIADAGGDIISVKHHRADGQDRKSWWSPKGTSSAQLWPINLEPDGAVWVCPGELKALAVATVGRASLGITSGEGSVKSPIDLPTRALELLRGREVAIAPDDDDTGRAWGRHVRDQLAAAGIVAWVVDLGLDEAAGLKDVGDWITQRLIEDGKAPDSVAATLDDHCIRADPWLGTSLGEVWQSGRAWAPVEHIRTGLCAFDRAYGNGLRTRGVHLLCGKAGQAKSQLAVSIALGAAKIGTPVGLLSLELGADEIAQLLAAQLGGIPRGVLASGVVRGEYGDRLQRVLREHSELPLRILDDAQWPHGLTRDRLGEVVAEGCKRFGWRIVIVDYLGLLAPSRDDQGTFDTDLRNATVLRKIARENDVALVLVAALRKSKATTLKAPSDITLDELAGAGRLAYDAQTVALVSRKQGDDDTGMIHVRPLKMRFASMPDGLDIQLRWKPQTGLIQDLPKGETQ